MSRDISNGIDNIKEAFNKKQLELTQVQWRDIRNKIDSLLLSTNIHKSDESRKICAKLDLMTSEERIKHITYNWGHNYLERVKPLLHQLDVIENLK